MNERTEEKKRWFGLALLVFTDIITVFLYAYGLLPYLVFLVIIIATCAIFLRHKKRIDIKIFVEKNKKNITRNG